MKYIALLRGINVGGNNKIQMAELKASFEAVACESVKTYINTGNIIFSHANDDLPALVKILEAAIEQDFKLKIKVLLLTAEHFIQIAKAIPEDWRNDKEIKSDIMFLWEEYDKPEVIEQLNLLPDIDHVIYLPGALLWSVDRTHQSRSDMQKLIGTKLYKHMTIRNCNTVRKLHSLME